MKIARLLGSLLLLALSALPALPQAVTGGETTITYTGANAQLVPPFTAATQFNTPNGLNTFILPVSNPSTSIRVYVTNNTANACASAFTLQIWAASDSQTSSFNNALTNWQVVPLQSSSGTLLSQVSVAIPASTATYVSSAVVSAPRIAIQLVNATGGCATTSLEVTAVLTQVSVTSPLVSVTGNQIGLGGPATNVQGIVPQGAGANSVYPVIAGGLLPGVNNNFLNVGFDNVSSGVAAIAAAGTYQLAQVPTPKQNGELAIVYASCPPNSGGSLNTLGGWTYANLGITCNVAGSNNGGFASQANTLAGNPFNLQYTNGALFGNGIAIITTFAPGTSVAGNGQVSGTAVTSGQGMLFGVTFNSTPCGVTGANGVRGAAYQLIKSVIAQQAPGGSGVSCSFLFATTNAFTSSGTEVVTLTGVSGTPLGGTQETVVISGFSPTTVTQQATSLQTDANGNLAVNFVSPPPTTTNTSTLDTGTFTTTFNGTTQTNTAGRGAIITIQLGTVSGTTPTLSAQLQWSPDGGATFLNYGAATANLTATGNTASIILYPTNTSQTAGATPANFTTGATTTLVENAPLPRTWRLVYTIGGTTPSFQINAVQVNYIN